MKKRGDVGPFPKRGDGGPAPVFGWPDMGTMKTDDMEGIKNFPEYGD